MDWETLVGQFGVAGIIIAGLIWDRFRLLKENTDLQKEVRNLYKDNVETLKGLTTSIKELASAQKDNR